VLKRERECDQFAKWQQGYSPKEHQQMRLLAEIELRNQAWQREQEALATTRHNEMQREARRQAIWAGVIALVAAIIGGVAAIIGGLLSRSWN
jgi:hypothetical protein